MADAFCGADDRVREAQSVFDGAQAERARTLAAFAVTVGSDAAVAELLGLNEREVRVARRTVGKSDARSLAGALLTHTPTDPPGPADPAVKTAPDCADPTPDPGGGDHVVATGPESAQSPIPSPRVQQSPAQRVAPAAPTEVKEWSHARDSLLVDGWNKGTDAAALATQLGIGLTQLVSRAQLLYADGRLMQVRRDRGRHRRLTNDFTGTVETAHEFDRALYSTSSANHPWPSSAEIPGQSDTTPYTHYGQDGSEILPSQFDSMLGNTGYPVQHMWAEGHSAER